MTSQDQMQLDTANIIVDGNHHPPSTASTHEEDDDHDHREERHVVDAFHHHEDNTEYEDDEDDDEEDDDASSSPYSSQATFGHACGIWFNPTVDVISNDLRDLPKGRRELVWSDMIGNDSNAVHFERGIRTESPETVENSLKDLDRDLKSMFSFGDTALRRARIQCPEYIDNRDFRLRFLRAERFHVKNAASRMLQHFEEKKFLFGEHCLGRDILLSDLNDDDIECLESGGHQVTPVLDRHGRTIELCNFHLLKETNVASKLSDNRARWYSLMTACQDESVQQNGIVRVIDALHDFTARAGKKFDAEYFKLSMKMYHAIPVKFVATYVVAEDDRWKPVLDQKLRFMPTEWRVRTRILKGSYEECQYDLMCVGVPKSILTMGLQHHKQWMETRRQSEGVKRRRV
mmetsp:Transcript_16613/g.28971  ORF Transcript_16613/g.28971 Transcript_16613/m.28971 type:complete len:403 (-) Transcript_16613:473-1681(-)